MDSVEYSQLLVKFDEELMSITENAEAAADGDIEGKEKDEAIQKALKKYQEYLDLHDRLLKDSDVLAQQFYQQNKFHIDLLIDSLKKLKLVK